MSAKVLRPGEVLSTSETRLTEIGPTAAELAGRQHRQTKLLKKRYGEKAGAKAMAARQRQVAALNRADRHHADESRFWPLVPSSN